MVESPVITGLMGFFAIVTLAAPAVLAYRYTPRWLDASAARKLSFHRDAVTALHRAMAQTPRDTPQYGRLQARYAENRAALRALAPNEVVPGID